MQTHNLLLRAFQKTDLDDIKRLMLNDEVMKFTGYREVQTEDFIAKELGRWIRESEHDMNYWHVSLKETKEFVGWAMLKKTISEFYEIGFMLVQNQWGNGYAVEMTKRILSFAKEDLNQEKIIASIHIGNKPSKRVVAKLGMNPSKDYISEKEILYFDKIL